MSRVIRTATINTVEPTFGAAVEPNVEIAAQVVLLATAVTDAGLAKTATAAAKVSTATAKTDATAADNAAGTAKTSTATAKTDATAADNAVATVVSDDTDTLAALDAFAAAVIAITGDGYAAHQFTFGGATGLTSAQVHTTFALLNTALTDFLAGQAAGVAAKATTVTSKASATTADTDTGTAKTATATSKTSATTADTNTGTADTAAGTAKTATEAVSLTSSLAGVSADVVLIFNTAAVVTQNKLREAVRGLLRLIEGSSSLSGT
jgi:hypothetical protein